MTANTLLPVTLLATSLCQNVKIRSCEQDLAIVSANFGEPPDLSSAYSVKSKVYCMNNHLHSLETENC